MALPDIKDAGILAGFERWGWPWHGLCEGGAIGSSGKTIPQPAGGNAWLIDKGLPALTLTPEQIASEAAAGREWRNYGMISGGQVYGKPFPIFASARLGPRNSTFIHVDEDGVNWMVNALGTVPSANTVRLTLSIVRFGHFESGVGAQTAITKTVDISCEDIEPSTEHAKIVDLQDVWTNGSKALFCVFIIAGDTALVFSAIELTLTGAGGADGSGLAVAAIEVKGQSSLTPNAGNQTGSIGTTGSVMSGIIGAPGSLYTNNYDCSGGADDCITSEQGRNPDGEFAWSGGGLHPLVSGYDKSYIRCRWCNYSATGEVRAYRYKYRKIIDHWISGAPAVSGSMGPNICYYNQPTVCVYSANWIIEVEGLESNGAYLLVNDTVIDEVVHVRHFAGSQPWIAKGGGINCFEGCDINTQYNDAGTTYAETSSEWTGSLPISTSLDWKYIDGGSFWGANLIAGWESDAPVGESYTFLSDDSTRVGLRRTDNIAAFYLLDPGRTYGAIVTPLGDKATSETGALYFAWQRKTGEFAFSANPICYV